MKTISLKIEDSIFGETERIVASMKKPRNRYINEALDFYNKIQQRRILEYRLKTESFLVKEDSMSVLKEKENCDIMIDQIRAINNKRLVKKIGSLPHELATKVKENLLIVLDINPF